MVSARKFMPDSVNESPLLNFDVYASAIAGLVESQSESGAFVFAIHGPWGSGKSTLMAAISRSLASGGVALSVEPLIVEFNAWKFQDREALWRALLLRVVGVVETAGVLDTGQSERIRAALYRAFEVDQVGAATLNYRKAVMELLAGLLRLWNLGFLAKIVDSVRKVRRRDIRDNSGQLHETEEFLGVFEREIVTAQIDKITSIEQFLSEFEQVVRAARNRGRSLVVLVDDLDRCLPEDTLGVFEAIKLFMDVPTVSFILALDRSAIRKALTARYRDLGDGFIDPDEYIEKVISMSFQIPPLTGKSLDEYVGSLSLSGRWTAASISLLRVGLRPNPRMWKRFVNSAEFLFDLLDASGREVPDLERERVVKVLCVAYRWSALFDLFSDSPRAMAELVALHGNESTTDFVKKWPAAASYVNDRELRHLLDAAPVLSGLDERDIEGLLALVSRVGIVSGEALG